MCRGVRRPYLRWLAPALGALLTGCSLDVGRPEAPEFDADLIAEVTRLLREVREAPSVADLTRFGLPGDVGVLQLACFPVVSGDTTRNASRVPLDQVQSWPIGRCTRSDVQVRSFSGSVRVQDLGGRFSARVTHGVSGVLGRGAVDVQVDFTGTLEVRAVDDTTGEARIERRLAERAVAPASSATNVRVQEFVYRWVDRLGVPRGTVGIVPARVILGGTLTRVASGATPDSVRVEFSSLTPLEPDTRCLVGYRAGEVEMRVTGTRSGITRFQLAC